jgi:hypothetical protein
MTKTDSVDAAHFLQLIAKDTEANIQLITDFFNDLAEAADEP